MTWSYWKTHFGQWKQAVCKKVGGWGMPNAYVFLHGGWVGLARCLRNQKKKLEKKGKLKKRWEYCYVLNIPETKKL